MTRKAATPILLALALAMAPAACASGGTPVQRLGPDELFARGQAELEAESWTKAVEAFQRLALEYPTYPRVQEARLLLGDAYMGQEEYLTAASELLRLVTDYPAGEYADDARFKVCQAYAALSPPIPRDQEYTRAAIEHCQALAAYYPDSELAQPALRVAEEMRLKLAEKVLYGGNFYFKRNAFDSAIIYFEDVLAQFADTPAAPKALLRLVEVYEELGYEEEKAEALQQLLERYPDSREAASVQSSQLAAEQR